MEYPSKFLADTVEKFSSLPGIGKRTALRLSLYLLKQNDEDVQQFSNSFLNLKKNVRFCKSCNNISDSELCGICSNPKREPSVICVVEDLRDVIAIERTAHFKGMYHVLGGLISPIDGIGPSDLNIESLVKKASEGNLREIILALSTTMEGDTTNFYIYKRLKEFNLVISAIARGVAVGDELEYTDEATLSRSIINRTPYENSLAR
jgi:recombination protein RecR